MSKRPSSRYADYHYFFPCHKILPHLDLDCEGTRTSLDNCRLMCPHPNLTNAEGGDGCRDRDSWLYDWGRAVQGSTGFGHPLYALPILRSVVIALHCHPRCSDQELSSVLQQLDHPAGMVDKCWVSCHASPICLLPRRALEALRAVL